MAQTTQAGPSRERDWPVQPPPPAQPAGKNLFPFFHLLPCDFSLADLSSLTSAQLAISWIIHPEYDCATHHRKIAKIWRGRREKGRATMDSALVGVNAPPDARAKDDFVGYELIDLSWDLPADLDELTSAQLSVIRHSLSL